MVHPAREPRLPELRGNAERALGAAGLTAFAARDHEVFEAFDQGAQSTPDLSAEFDITTVAID